MRKFFSFRSSSYGSENDNVVSSDLNKNKKKVHSGATEDIKTKTSNQKKVYGSFRDSENNVLKPLNQNLKDEISSDPCLRRSLSFSSAAVCSHLNDESFGSLIDQSRLTSCRDNEGHVGQYPVECHSSFTADRLEKLDRENFWLNATEKPSTPRSFGFRLNSSSSNSACSSPIPLRRRTICPSLISSQSNAIDLYIDEEHENTNAINDSQKCASMTGDGKLAENSKIPIIGRPPRALCTASSSPHYITNNIRSCSFREIIDKRYDHSISEQTSDYFKHASQHKYLQKNIEGISCAFLDKSVSGIRECNPRLNTPVEDTLEDSSDGNTTLNSDGRAQGCPFDLIPLDKELGGHWLYELSNIQRKFPFLRKGQDDLFDSKVQEHGTNEGLLQKLKELEERDYLSPEEASVSEKLHHGSLATELSTQIRSRLTERSLAKELLKQSMWELNIRTRRLEKENNELKLSLDNELNRRTNEWSLKLSKFQAEEQRLRERVRELAEQNVSLQREISLIQGSELETRNIVAKLERQLNESKASQDELKTKNCSLNQALLELQGRCNRAEEQRDHLKISSNEREKENMELQKLVGRLQRTCNEQDKTISGLRQSYSCEIEKKFLVGDNDVVQIQTEKMRLSGVEQKLRRELESCRIEVDSLRNENVQLLHRLQGTGSEYGFSLVRLNLELHAWVESLKMQSLSLLDDGSHFSGQLLDIIACKRSENFEDAVGDTDEYSTVELNLKYQNLTRAIGSFKRNLQILSATLKEKSTIEASKCMCQTTEIDSSKQLKNHKFQDEIEVELKAEAIVNRLLREKICSKEQENEQLHGDLASSIRRGDLLQTDIQRLQDEFSCLNHKKRDLEIQMLKKDDKVMLLQQDLQECAKDLSTTRSLLTNVSGERDRMWEEVQRLRESKMQIDYEIESLQKRIERLDEDMLYKEGQISILKDSLANKAIDITGSPNSLKEFNLQ